MGARRVGVGSKEELETRLQISDQKGFWVTRPLKVPGRLMMKPWRTWRSGFTRSPGLTQDVPEIKVLRIS
ncbi:unnamed protein product [Lota lota]